jgi:3',5'-cyclic AMP phosphodiesterase CpdA
MVAAPSVPSALALPAPEDVRNAAAAAARAAGVGVGVRGPGPEIGAVPPGTPVHKELWALDRNDPNPVPVEGYDMILARAPWATLGRDGQLTVAWETRVPTPAGVVYVGQRVEEDPLALPRHRGAKREELASGAATATQHQVVVDVRRYLTATYDVNGVAARGWGEIAWRVENYDPDQGTTRLFDGRTGFRATPEGELVQLPTVTLGPLVDRLTDTEVVVTFETDVPTGAAVGVDGHAPVTSGGPAVRHEIRVTGLAPASPHVYQVAVSDGVETGLSPYSTFRTRTPGAPVTVAILSDSRAGAGPGLESYEGVNAAVLGTLLARAARDGAEAIAFPGDLVDGYVTRPDVLDFQLRSWLKVVEGVHGSVPIYEGVGNHEVVLDAWSDLLEIDKSGEDATEARFAAMFVNPENGPPPEREGAPPYVECAYSWDIGPAHFVMLDTNYWWASDPGNERLGGRGNRDGFLMDGQLGWLDADLGAARSRGAEHVVVMGHYPAFPVGGHADDGMWFDNALPDVNAMRERFWNVLSKHDVLAYVSGHEHNYSRALIGSETVPGAANPVWSIISGGSGAPYYAQDTPAEYADRVETFSTQQHYTLWTFDGPQVRLQVIGLTGDVIEDLLLEDGPLVPIPALPIPESP